MRARAMATTVMLLVVNLIACCFGSLFIGAISDILFRSGVAELSFVAGELARNQRHPAVVAQLTPNLREVCGQIYSQSLQTAMVIMACLYLASALFFLLSWTLLAKYMVDRGSTKPATA